MIGFVYSSVCSPCKEKEEFHVIGKDNKWLAQMHEYCKKRVERAGQTMAAWEDAADRIESYMIKERD